MRVRGERPPPFTVSIAHGGEKGRGEIGGVYLSALLAGAMHHNFDRDGASVDIVKGGGACPPALTRLGCIYHRDVM